MGEKTKKQQNFERGAVILLASTIIVKIIGAIFKIPLQHLLVTDGFGYFTKAYELFVPIYALSMAGLPIAVSRLTANYMAEGRFKDVRKILTIAKRAFLVTGLAGFIIMLAIIYPYVDATAGNVDEAKYITICIIMIAPTILFCSYMSAYRGYYEGMRNMFPTAISDIIEALGKLVLGLSFAYITLKIFNVEAYAAAAALMGVTVGTIAAAVFLVLRHKIVGDPIDKKALESSPQSYTDKVILKSILVIALPVALSSLANNVTLFIDNFMINSLLKKVMENSADTVFSMYAASVADYQATAEALGRKLLTSSNMPNFLYGIRGEAYVLYNLVPSITATLGIGSVPFLTTVWIEKDMVAVKKTIEKILRTTAVIAIPAGIGLCSISPYVMGLLYDGVAPVEIGTPLLRMLGIAAVFSGLSVPMTNMLQAIGKPMLPVRNIAIGACLKIVVNLILVSRPELNIMGAPIGTTLCYVTMFVLNLYSLIKHTGVHFNFVSVIIKPFISALSCGVAAYFVSMLCDYLKLGNLITVVCSVAVAGIVYILVLFGIKTLSREDIEGFPKGKKIASILEKLHFIR